jgi:imidazolonepropionase-like amidohydrolase
MSKYDLLLNGDVWDAQNGSRSDYWVAVQDETIADVSSEKPGTAAIERTAEAILPGLCDMHVHLVWDGSGDPVETLRAESKQETTLRAVRNAREQLRGGVTTIRDVGSVDNIAIAVARAVKNGWVAGPRTYASGRTVIISGGHDPFWGLESDGPKACRRAVRQLRSAGADLIKVSATGGVYGQAVGEDPGVAELSVGELTAIVEEAHRFEMDVAAHAVGREGIANAIEAGVDTIEHGNQLDPELIDTLAASGATYDPTLYVYAGIAAGGDGEIPAYAQRNAQRVYEQHAEAFRSALDTDIRFLAGSDAGSPDVPHPGLHLELQQMVAEGMTATAALEAATLAAARELGRPGLGLVEAGTPADLVCFDADPHSDVATVATPQEVVKEGKLVDC